MLRFCLVVSIVAAMIAGDSPAFAEIRTAYVWADDPSAERYSPRAAYAAVPGDNEIRRTGTGRYSVDLRGFLPGGLLASGTRGGALGNIQVSAYGDSGHFCQIVNWSAIANILCFNAAGRPADTRFSLLAATAQSDDPVAYAWAGQPATDSYNAAPSYAISPAGPVRVTRRGTGHYNIAMGASVAGVGGNVQVSAYGSDPRHCRIAGWIGGLVDVRCTDVSGRPADTAVSVIAMRVAEGSRDFAYAWSDNATRELNRPDRRYTFAPEASGGVQIDHEVRGRYRVRLGARINQVQVSAYGADEAYCNPVSWSASQVNVACFGYGGAPRDSRFTVLGVNRDGAGLVIVDPRPIPLPDFDDVPVDPPTPLFGYADLHVHPASFLGFGGNQSGLQGMMWGRPAVGDSYSGLSPTQRFQACTPESHARSSADSVQNMLREVIIGTADERTHMSHTPHGGANFETWPNSMIVSHQQIDVDWLRRAHSGGLRVIVAAAVDNEIVDKAYDWTLGDVLRVAAPLLRGDPIRAALRMPSPEFGMTSAIEQLDFIKLLVDENDDFMAIATTGSEARSIVTSGKLAVILGTELDTLSPDQIRTLVDDHDVRFVTPIHFVDNEIGGSAAYESMFSMLNGIVGRDSQPYSLIEDPAIDFFIGAEFGTAQAELNRLTRSALGWDPIGEICGPDGDSAALGGALRCRGRRNANGLTDDGVTLVNWLMGKGVMVDLAHMSEISQSRALDIAESKQCPVINSHTEIRPDSFRPGANERAMPDQFARRLLDLGGVIGLGTGMEEVGDPRRIYYNAGNPLIDLRHTSEWLLDLRQPELQQTPPTNGFSQYRVTLRIGSDNLEASNTVRGRLLSRGGRLDDCILANSTVGAESRRSLVTICNMASRFPVAAVDGFRLEHNGVGGVTGDNVDIEEFRVEANIGTIGSPEWLTVIQRTGGHESEVVRLKGRSASSAPDVFGSDFWVTRLLPRPEDLVRPGERITGLRIRTFTNEDNLSGSGPAAVTVDLKGHRSAADGEALRRLLGGGGDIGNGVFTDDILVFPSRAERLISDMPDRAPLLSFDALTLTTGEDGTAALLQMINDYRDIARTTGLNEGHLTNAIGALAPAVIGAGVGVAGWALSDPMTAGLIGVIIFMQTESYDNWSTLVSAHAIVSRAGVTEERPLLVGYNPTQRLRRDTSASTLFRNLPERIEADRPYGGLVIDYKLINQGGDDSVYSNDLEFEVEFSDGSIRARPAALRTRLKVNKSYRLVLPFDRLRRGLELKAFRIRVVGRSDILFRELDIGLVKDPMQSFLEEFEETAALGDYRGQLAVGTDLSGFEALTPFSAIRPGPFTASATGFCPDASPVAGPVECTTPSLDRVLFSGRPVDSVYRLNVEQIAGRADPARANPSLSIPAELAIGEIAGGRLLDFRETGLSTVGQLPEFVAAAHHADQLLGDGPAVLGPDMFRSVDALVRAWERLDHASRRGAASEDPEGARCSP